MRRNRHFAVLTLIAILAGCAEHPESSQPSPSAAPVLESPAPAPPESGKILPPVPSPKPPAPRLPEKPSANPAELIGLDQAGVIKLLGEPAELRDEGAAHVLTYRGRTCQLQVIFFLDVKSGAERVLSYDLRPAYGHHGSGCYNALRSGK